METINIFGDNMAASCRNIREASRGLLFSEGDILLTHEDNGQYFIPGGGSEGEESAEQCCIRELSEETGFVVRPAKQFLTINEYYGDWLYVSRYFLCGYEGRCERMLTPAETEVGLTPVWRPFEEALAEFARYGEFAGTDEMRRGAYLREYTALDCFIKDPEAMRMRESLGAFDSEYASVRYSPRYNVVLVVWKKFCCRGDYRAPLEFALDLIKRYGCDYCADTRSGFEDIPEDTAWVSGHFMPRAAEYGCKRIYFIIDSGNTLKDELEGQQANSADIMEFRYIYDISQTEESV